MAYSKEIILKACAELGVTSWSTMMVVVVVVAKVVD